MTGKTCSHDHTVLSRHTTIEGVIVYTRCPCGTLHIWNLRPDSGQARLVAGGHHYDVRNPAEPVGAFA